jgi:iron(III) transport system substrate-binding protein
MRGTDIAGRVMRGLALALALASPVAAFEIEEEAVFGPEGAVRELAILSTTDRENFAPLIEAFLARTPGLRVRYTVASSQEVYVALAQEGASYDLAVSSAMDLQMKLANDGLAQALRSGATERLPDWAHWRDQLFAFAQEPVVTIVSQAAFADLPLPRTRSDLVDVMRDNPALFEGRVGTYDPNRSGAGYLFATQDARQSDTSWRLAEVMGALSPRLYAASGDMIADLQRGDLILAYNVLGSYAAARLVAGSDARMIELEDFTHVLLRTALVPVTAEEPELGAAFLDFLLSAEGQRLLAEEAALPPLDARAMAEGQHLRPIRLDPGLLVYVDPLKRRRFLAEWSAAMIRD